MPSIKMTARTIEAIKPPTEGQVDYWDEDNPGFGLRVSSGGRRAWVLMYRHGGVKRRLTLGTNPPLSLADARDAADKAMHAVQHEKKDPAAEKKAERKAETVAELAAIYIERHAKREKRSWRVDQSILDKDVLPRFKSRKAKDITRRDIIAMLDDIVARGAPIQANRTLEIVRKMFNWAISRDIIEISPCYRVGKPSSENARDRVLSADEIKALWTMLDKPDLEMTRPVALALKLQLVTAQRIGEVIGMAWSEIDLDGDKVWTIPAEKAKNGLAHRVPLSVSALAILAEVKAIEAARRAQRAKRRKCALKDVPESPWVFPSPRQGAAIDSQAVSHAMQKNLDALGITDAVPHDLRRTAASHMTGMGINRLVVSKILNHVEKGVTAVYDRHGYDAEKKHALDAWAARLGEIITSKKAAGNVKEFKRA